ncbi:MAG: hypothetical protein ACOCU6_01660, partial [Nanoarchaeota archaeon]
IISETRKYLREIYGVFQHTPLSSFQQRIASIRSIDDPLCDFLLDNHQSTRERHAQYVELYTRIERFCSSCGVTLPFSVLDLACGWNPFAIKYFSTLPSQYIASDISEEDMGTIRLFFRNTGLNGRCISLDLTSKDAIDELNRLSSVDVVFLFKTLDSLERSSRNISKRLLSFLASKASVFVISFPSVSIGGKQDIDKKRRAWFESWCSRNKWYVQRFSLENELVYMCAPSRKQ